MRQSMLKDRNLAENNTKLNNAKGIGSKNFKTNARGITLIALVITIIVLLILAGVSISAITGNDSAMQKAEQAKNSSEAGDELDFIKLAVVDAVSHGDDGWVSEANLANALEGLISSDQIAALRADATGAKANLNGPWEVTGSKGAYRIERDGQVKAKEGAYVSNSPIVFTDTDTAAKSITLAVETGAEIVSVTWPTAPSGAAFSITGVNNTTATVHLVGTVSSNEAGYRALVAGVPVTVTGTVNVNGVTKNFTSTCTIKYTETTVSTIAITNGSSMTVNKDATGTITVEGRGSLGETVALTSTDIGKISYTSGAEATATVAKADNGNGTVTGVAAGTTTITVKYNNVSVGTVTVTVKKALVNPINLGVDVDGSGSMDDDWEILYDGRDANAPDALSGKVYCILEYYLSNERRTTLGINSDKFITDNTTYGLAVANDGTNNSTTLKDLLNGTNLSWSSLVASGLRSIVTVQGALDKNTMNTIKGARDPQSYYLPHPNTSYDGCAGYWLASTYSGRSVWWVDLNGQVFSRYYDSVGCGVCPVVVIPASEVNITTANGVTTVTPKTN